MSLKSSWENLYWTRRVIAPPVHGSASFLHIALVQAFLRSALSLWSPPSLESLACDRYPAWSHYSVRWLPRLDSLRSPPSLESLACSRHLVQESTVPTAGSLMTPHIEEGTENIFFLQRSNSRNSSTNLFEMHQFNHQIAGVYFLQADVQFHWSFFVHWRRSDRTLRLSLWPVLQLWQVGWPLLHHFEKEWVVYSTISRQNGSRTPPVGDH